MESLNLTVAEVGTNAEAAKPFAITWAIGEMTTTDYAGMASKWRRIETE